VSEAKSVSGTKEWSVASVNNTQGCLNGCKYCYAREMAGRFGRIQRPEDWLELRVNRYLNKEQKKYPGTVMFPSTHDIFEENYDACLATLQNLLTVGNQVLIVSKPRLAVMRRLLGEMIYFQDQILLRFTIGCLDRNVAKVWEPFAPRPQERVDCLKHAYRQGYRTSVSMEPMLDTGYVVQDVVALEPFVTDSIWLGKMNMVRKRAVGVAEAEIERIENGQTKENILRVYAALNGHPKVRWKESIKKVVGLPLETEAGTDR